MGQNKCFQFWLLCCSKNCKSFTQNQPTYAKKLLSRKWAVKFTIEIPQVLSMSGISILNFTAHEWDFCLWKFYELMVGFIIDKTSTSLRNVKVCKNLWIPHISFKKAKQNMWNNVAEFFFYLFYCWFNNLATTWLSLNRSLSFETICSKQKEKMTQHFG